MINKKIGVISLGCDKNRVDTEKMLATLDFQHTITNDIQSAEIIIINSCAFLESSRAETIETVFECNKYRQTGCLEKLIMTGCMPAKFIDEMWDELVEVDVFLGFLDYDKLLFAIDECYKGKRLNLVGKGDGTASRNRKLTTPMHYAYLKIADGCDNFCTYCLIPSIRGKYTSNKMQDLIDEAKELGDVQELILVAQDITRYGSDIYGKPMLVELIQQLTNLQNVSAIRLLYCYPDMITDELIHEMKTNPKLLKYIDIPLQHCHDKVLKRMNRKGSRAEYLQLIEKLKAEVTGIAIRSTFITAFPGETQEQFESMKEFLHQAKLFNCGFFAYSKEKGTPSYNFKGHLTDEVKQDRLKQLYAEQKIIADGIYQDFVGKTVEVVCDGIDYDKQMFVGRAYFNAPDIDGLVYFTANDVVNQGERYNIKINKTEDFNLYGEINYEFTK